MPKGRTHGSLNEQIYKWRIGILDRETGETLYNKYCSINEFNRMHMIKIRHMYSSLQIKKAYFRRKVKSTPRFIC